MKTKITQQIEELMKEYEENKHRYSSLGHFCDLGLYNLEHDSKFEPEEMSHEMIKEFIRKEYHILGISEEE